MAPRPCRAASCPTVLPSGPQALGGTVPLTARGMLASQKHYREERWPETPQQRAPKAREGSPSQHHTFRLAPRSCSIHIQDPEAGADTLQVGELQV